MTRKPTSLSFDSQKAISSIRTLLLVVSFISAIGPTCNDGQVDRGTRRRGKEGRISQTRVLDHFIEIDALCIQNVCLFAVANCLCTSLHIYTKHTDGLLLSLLSKTEQDEREGGARKKMTREIQMLIAARSDRKKGDERYQ